MTKLKFKIVLTCLFSVALILCVLLAVVFVLIPKNLEKQAKIAIKHEYEEYDPEGKENGVNFLS